VENLPGAANAAARAQVQADGNAQATQYELSLAQDVIMADYEKKIAGYGWDNLWAQAKTYDEAVQLLLKLQDLAAYQNQKPAFQTRLNQIYDQYSKHSAFIKRLQSVGLRQR
jgi:uncharacterized protein (DUF4415 family)